MSKHSEVSIGARHPVHDFTFANTGAREGASGILAADVGKVAKQDDGTYWLVQSIGPLTWVEITSQGGGGGGFSFYLPNSGAATEGEVDGFRLFDFAVIGGQSIFAKISVPSTYKTGKQIKLLGGKYVTTVTSGNVFFKAITSLIVDGVGGTVMGNFTNQHTSTNVEQTVQGVSNTFDPTGDIDLTNGSGQINGQTVNPGNLLLIELIRDVANESSPAAADARLGRDSFAPTFS